MIMIFQVLINSKIELNLAQLLELNPVELGNNYK